MKIIRNSIFILSCISLFSFNLRNDNNEFHLIFGSGFRNDTVSLEINGIRIMEDIILQSDTIIGACSTASVHLENGNLFLLNEELQVVKSLPFQYDRELRVIITINKRPYDLRADLKNGKYMVVSKHWYYYNVYLNQYKKPVSFE